MNEETKGPEAPTSEKPEFREISKEELAEILEAHRKWVESQGKQGKHADLSRANLQKANLENACLVLANLREANLSGANLQGADLKGANLQRADFEGANLQEADLLGTNLQRARLYAANLQGAEFFRANLQGAFLKEATLQGTSLTEANLQGAFLREANLQGAHLMAADVCGADLTKAKLQGAGLEGVEGLAEARLQNANFDGATGLLGTEFARADVTGAKLPEDIRDFKILETVAETSKNARKIFLAMLSGCAYSLLTIATTTDARLLTNSASSPLPIIRTEIPIAWFYWAAPFALLGFYVYLHFYLGMLWEGLAGLPAKFPDGKRLDERAYPWLLNGQERAICGSVTEVHALQARPLDLSDLGVELLLIADSRPVLRLDRNLCFYQVGERAVANFFKGLRHPFLNELLRAGNIGPIRIASPKPLDCAEGEHRKQDAKKRCTGYLKDSAVPPKCLPPKQRRVGPSQCSRRGTIENDPESNRGHQNKNVQPRAAPFVTAKVSEPEGKQGRWDGPPGEKDDGPFLELDKERAALFQPRKVAAHLVKADLDEADLRMASLYDANLQGADLFGANLQEASLVRANLQEAFLGGANLREAALRGANLQRAFLELAKLQGADLRYAGGLTQEQLDSACGDAETKLPPGMSIKPCPQEKKQETK